MLQVDNNNNDYINVFLPCLDAFVFCDEMQSQLAYIWPMIAGMPRSRAMIMDFLCTICGSRLGDPELSLALESLA